ncbi:MAG: hypothetical protein LBJ12_08550 [Oscillospiraceae bacterium]|jgi:stage III sporulation protein AB|nr:hypothetical protein [Oscillospiraceae bacterium]
MNIIGATFVTVSAALLGRYWVSRLRAREDILGMLVIMISRLQTELEYAAPPLESLLETLCAASEQAFLADCRTRLADGASFPEAWRAATEHGTPQLNKSDRAKLIAFGQGLGTTDLAGQSRACKLYSALFTEAQDSARREREKYGAYLPRLSLLLGLCAAVLLL